MILGFLAMTVGSLVEMFYIGQLGKLELAAITFTFPIWMALNAMTRGIGVGASTLIAQSRGEGDRTKTAITITHCYLLIILFTVSSSLLGQVYVVRIFSLIGADGEVLTLASQYAGIWFYGFPMMGVAMVSNGLIRAYGNVVLPGMIMAIAPVVQVIVGPFLIFGLFGFPQLGLAGAAWAFVAGAMSQALLSAHWYFVTERLFTGHLSQFIHSARQILVVGIPAATTNLLQPISMGVVTWLLSGFGTTVVAGFGVASRIDSVVAMVVIGIGTSVVPIVGQNWGARKFDRVYETLKTCYIACLAWGVIAASIMWIGAEYFVNAINDDPSLVDISVTYLHIVPFSIGFMGLIHVANHSFNAIRKPLPGLLLSIARLLIVYIPMALFASHYFGYVGIFVASALTSVIVGIVAVLWNRRTLKREQQLII